MLGNELLDLAQEPQELLMPVARLVISDHRTGGHVQSSRQGGGAVADVVVGDALHVAQTHGQQRLGPVQGLDLGLLVNVEHHRHVGLIEVKADDVAHLLDKEWIR